MKKIFATILAAFSMLSCTSLQVSEVNALKGSEEVCIVDNKYVKPDFRDAYERRINANGYKTKIIPARKDSSCELVSTYSATYGQHWGVYLKTAVLKVYRSEKLAGEAKYKAPYASPGKHGRVENKIESMVNQLLPKI